MGLGAGVLFRGIDLVCGGLGGITLVFKSLALQALGKHPLIDDFFEHSCPYSSKKMMDFGGFSLALISTKILIKETLD